MRTWRTHWRLSSALSPYSTANSEAMSEAACSSFEACLTSFALGTVLERQRACWACSMVGVGGSGTEICCRSFLMQEIFGTGAEVGVGYKADFSRAIFDSSIALVVATIGLGRGFAMGCDFGVLVTTGLGLDLGLGFAALGSAVLGPLTTVEGRVGLRTQGSSAGLEVLDFDFV